MPDHPPRDRPPVVRASDGDRDAVVARLQQAMAEGRLDLDEFGQRVEAAQTAVTTADLDALVADLPRPGDRPVEIVGSRTQESSGLVLGDITHAGGGLPPRRAATVFGDIRIDLRALRTDADRVDLQLSTVFGDIDVVVPEGVDAELHGRNWFGDRKVDLAPVPRLAGTPLVVVRAWTVFGDLRLRSLAPGESASRWRVMLERLAQRSAPTRYLPPPPPGAPPPLPPPPF